uniref:Uncharacterized protein n=1 Tax=Arundo donax TaxID=35708 RepID=A0A0A9AAS6_ARUDO
MLVSLKETLHRSECLECFIHEEASMWSMAGARNFFALCL